MGGGAMIRRRRRRGNGNRRIKAERRTKWAAFCEVVVAVLGAVTAIVCYFVFGVM